MFYAKYVLKIHVKKNVKNSDIKRRVFAKMTKKLAEFCKNVCSITLKNLHKKIEKNLTFSAHSI